ncbi:MAG: MFS transporter [Pirellulales bacterium]|nr:MFS transporter [Pirellulales bacterium]
MTTPSSNRIGRNLHYERWRWQIFAITWLAYFGFYLTRKTFSVAKIGMEQDPDVLLTPSDMAWIDGAYLVAYAVGQFLSGIFADRSGTRKVVLVGMSVSVLAAAAMGASSITVMLGIFFCLQGACQSTGWAPLMKNMGNFFSQRERGTVIGLWSTNYAVGGMVASVFAGYWGDLMGWRFAFFIPAATLLGVWVLFILFQRNRPEDVGLPSIETYHGEETAVLVEDPSPEDEHKGSWKVIKEVLSNRTLLVICLAYFLTKPARYAILFWGPKYINEKLGSGMTESGAISALFETAGIAGAILSGVVSDRVFGARRAPVCVIALVALGGFLLVMDGLPATRVVMAGSYLLIGLLIFVPDTILNGPAAIDFGTKQGAATAAGFINGAGSVGGIIGGTIPGFFADRWGWNGVFLLLGGMALTAAVVLMPQWNAMPATASRTKE